MTHQNASASDPQQPQRRRWFGPLAGFIAGLVLAAGGTALAGATSGEGALRRAFVEDPSDDDAGWFRTTGTNSLGEPGNPQDVLTQTGGGTVTCGASTGELIAASGGGADAPRWVRFENEDAAGDGFRFAIGGAATANDQLVPVGGVIWRYTAAAVNCIRSGGADATVTTQRWAQRAP